MNKLNSEIDVQSTSMVILGIIMIVIGSVIAIMRTKLIFTVFQLGSTSLIIASALELVLLVLGQKDSKHLRLIMALVFLITGAVLNLFPNIPLSIIIITFGVYSLCSGLAKFITYILYLKDRIAGRLFLLADSILFIVLGICIIISPISYAGQLFFLIGLYGIALGYTYIRDGLNGLIPTYTKEKYKRKIRINLPIFLVAIIPYRVLNYINNYLLTKDEIKTQLERSKSDEQCNVEVLIHVTENGFGTLGHVDLIIDNYVISYGNYDTSSYRLFETIGDGVLFIAPKKQYIELCIHQSKKTLFSFGLKLNDEQYNRVLNKIEEIKSRLYRWYTPIEQGNIEANDYASRLVQSTGAKLYKFKNSRFKTYFVLSTNCVLLADSVLGKAGTDLLNINGVITPGTYYDYFNREFYKEGSFVITKKVYK